MIVTRFAPSPNGHLHLGHAFSAIVAHDLARKAGGRFVVRIEDIDGERSRSDLAEDILTDLHWLGLSWDGPVVYQSNRLDTYASAAERLKAMGLLYPCQCTRNEIAARATAFGPDGPVYPGTCRNNPNVPTKGAAWRLDMARAVALSGPLSWRDETAGVQQMRAELTGDIVLVRKNLPASYHLAATLDDAADGVNLVTRGADLFAATHIHRLLQALLGLNVPVWHHHGLLRDDTGRKLAKSRSSPSLATRRQQGEGGRRLADQLRALIFPAGISLSPVLEGMA